MTYRIIDERTDAEKQATCGFIVANDDWGDSRFFIVRPVKEHEEANRIMDVMKTERSDLKRVRYVCGTKTKDGLMYKPRIGENDRVHIYNFATFLPKGAGCVHVGSHVSHQPIRGKIVSSDLLEMGVTDVVTEKGRGLLLDERRVSGLLPEQELHERDAYWQAWVIGDDKIREVLRCFDLDTKENTRHAMLEMMRGYQRESLDFFTGEDVLDASAYVCLSTKAVQGVLLTLTS